MERTVAFIVARLSSSRLPGKQLLEIGDRALLAWTIQGLKSARRIDAIVLATTAEPVNDPLARAASGLGIDIFRYAGDPNHLTTRLVAAAKAFKSDISLLISGDCPLVDGPLLDRMINTLQSCPIGDYVTLQPDAAGIFPLAEGIGVYRTHAWERADQLSTTLGEKEHLFPVIHQSHAHLFTPVPCRVDPCYHTERHRISVDTWADVEFHRALYAALLEQRRKYNLVNVVRLLQERPHLKQINLHVHQKGTHEPERTLLILTAGGGSAGYGHLSRCRELAMQATEQLGAGVTCVVDGNEAAAFFAERGVRTITADPMGDEATHCARRADWTIVDLPPHLAPDPEWRRHLAARRVLVLDSLEPWAAEADLVVVPGVVVDPEKKQLVEKRTPVHHGREYLILRREIAAMARHQPEKETDLLTYLHHEEATGQVAGLCRRTGWSLRMSQNFSGDFHRHLAHSRVLVNGFGVSSYEAMALQCVPVTWPHSPRHREEARTFYRALALPPLVADNISLLEELVGGVLADPPSLPALKDGCGRILSLMTGEDNR